MMLIHDYERKELNRATERGDLMMYFVTELNKNRGKLAPLTMPRMGKILQGLELKDLYYMQSYFKDLERNKGIESASKWFWWSLRHEYVKE